MRTFTCLAFIYLVASGLGLSAVFAADAAPTLNGAIPVDAGRLLEAAQSHNWPMVVPIVCSLVVLILRRRAATDHALHAPWVPWAFSGAIGVVSGVGQAVAQAGRLSWSVIIMGGLGSLIGWLAMIDPTSRVDPPLASIVPLPSPPTTPPAAATPPSPSPPLPPAALVLFLIASLFASGCALSVYDKGRETLTIAHLATNAARQALDAYDEQQIEALKADVKVKCAPAAPCLAVDTPCTAAVADCLRREGQAALDAESAKFEAGRKALFVFDGGVTVAGVGINIAEQMGNKAGVAPILQGLAPAAQAVLDILTMFGVKVPDFVTVLPMLIGSGL